MMDKVMDKDTKREMVKCENCLYSNRLNHPGPQPEPTQRPAFFGLIVLQQNPPQQIMDQYHLHKHLYNNAVQCQRYPKMEIVLKGYGCGEFKDRWEAQ